jgi:formylglycine-generating enzyme required for sulfatase activity
LGSPQTFVSWNDCQEFVKVLNQKTNGGYRLPEDLEWDYVFKVDLLGNNQNALKPPGMPNFPGVPRATPGIDGTTSSYKPNVFGLYGGINPNLSEWCENVHLNYQNPFPIDKQAKEKLIASSGANSIRAMRSAPNGMGWQSNTINGSPASMRNFNYTFRIVKTIIPDTDEKIVKAVLSKVLAMVEKDLVLIPAGTFLMGSPTTEVRRKNDETQHQVTLTKPFYMGKYEVTQEQWEGVMGINPSKTKGEKLPVTDVSWNDCQEFIKKLNSKTNGGYRLPTEAEWEYACRAGTTTMYSVGNSLTKSDANIDSDSIKAVGGYKPNTFGLHDMHGNVYEWCEDWKADYPEGAITNPKGPASGSTRVLRVGSFSIYESVARSSFRFTFAPSLRDLVGFRLARNEPP